MVCECSNEIKENDKFCSVCGKENSEFKQENLVTENSRNTKKSNKKEKTKKKIPAIITGIVVFLAIISIGTYIYMTFLKSSVEISDVDASQYPYVVISVIDDDGARHSEYDFKVFQDTIEVNYVKELGSGKFGLFLDNNLEKGDQSIISLKDGFVKQDYTIKIRNNILDKVFSKSELVDENYPEIFIETDIPKAFDSMEVIDEISITVGDNEYELVSYEYKKGDNKAILKFNIDGFDRTSDFKFIYNLPIFDQTIKVDSLIHFEPLEINMEMYFEDDRYGYEYITNYEDLTELPYVKLDLNVVDFNNVDITNELDLEKFSVQDTVNGTQIEDIKVSKEADKISIRYNIGHKDNLRNEFLIVYAGNKYHGEFSYSIDSYSYVRAANYVNQEFDSKHTYEVLLGDYSWDEAKEKAEEKGGYLVCITSEEELDHVAKEIENSSASSATVYWTGASMYYGEPYYDFVWQDNYYIFDMYDAFWLEGEPSYYDYTNRVYDEIYEDAVVLFYRSSENKWVLNDVPMDLIFYYPYYSGKIAYIIEYDN